ncbi:uncharacterized protein LOC122857846 [Aphidius gifuensis]|uniref:uncharacterized protein LOC122857846 n=1 Tax=Aphidius gifuensis TaxID=684658 RepID=UPI001CDCDC64|nr:uncharacterized protein LOC122857846 [Aphidius gifuensis]
MELDKKMNNVKWNKDTEYALGLHKKLINFLGYWPTEYQKLAKIRVIIISVILIAVVIIFIRNFILYGNCGTDEELAETLIIATANIMSIIKVLLSWYHKNHYNYIINSLIKDWHCVNDNNSRKIMLKYAKIGRNILIFQLLGSYGTLISLFIRYPSTDEVVNKYNNDTILLRNIPYGLRCWIPLTMPWNLYVGHYLMLCINGFVTVTAYIGGCLFMFTIAIHICGQFDILHNSIENVIGVENYKQQCFIIKKFVIRHNELLEILKQFEEACNIIIFFEVFTNAIGICINANLMSTIKVILCWHHKNHYNNILQSIIEDWYCVNDNKTRKIMLKYAKIGRNILIFQLIGSYGTLIPMFVRYPSTDEVVSKYNNETILLRDIPSGLRCWIPLTMPWYLYVGHYLIFCINGFVTVTAYKFVIRHNELLELLSQFEEACNIIIFFEVFTNTFGICING